jgi:hypothetical protein
VFGNLNRGNVSHIMRLRTLSFPRSEKLKMKFVFYYRESKGLRWNQLTGLETQINCKMPNAMDRAAKSRPEFGRRWFPKRRLVPKSPRRNDDRSEFEDILINILKCRTLQMTPSPIRTRLIKGNQWLTPGEKILNQPAMDSKTFARCEISGILFRCPLAHRNSVKRFNVVDKIPHK